MIPADIDFRTLKTRVSVEQVLADKGLLARLRWRGDCWVGPCPLHGGDNPNAFVAHRTRNLWHCFTGCNAGGDVVELARRLGYNYREAAHYLAGLAACFPAALGVPTPVSAPRSFRPFLRRLHLQPNVPFLQRKGIRPETARLFEVGAFRGAGMLSGCIGVRLHDSAGGPLGYAGRRLDPQQAARRGKWVFPPGLPRSTLLYGYHRLTRPHRPTVLVECPWGVMRLAQLGLPAVALLGTSMSDQQRALLDELPGIILMLDADGPGNRAALAIARRLVRSRTVHLPEPLDPDDLTDGALRTLLSL